MKFQFEKQAVRTWTFSFGWGMGMGWLYLGRLTIWARTNKKDAEIKKDAVEFQQWEKDHPMVKCSACNGHGFIHVGEKKA